MHFFVYFVTTFVYLCIYRGHPSEWLQKRDSHRLCELSYLEVGLGSQIIHMEFDVSAAAYTLLVRDSAQCKHFYNQLEGKCPPSHLHIHLHAHSFKCLKVNFNPYMLSCSFCFFLIIFHTSLILLNIHFLCNQDR